MAIFGVLPKCDEPVSSSMEFEDALMTDLERVLAMLRVSSDSTLAGEMPTGPPTSAVLPEAMTLRTLRLLTPCDIADDRHLMEGIHNISGFGTLLIGEDSESARNRKKNGVRGFRKDCFSRSGRCGHRPPPKNRHSLSHRMIH